MTSLEWIDDVSLTKEQKRIKWYLYTEIDMTYELEDLKYALGSLLTDVLHQSRGLSTTAKRDE